MSHGKAKPKHAHEIGLAITPTESCPVRKLAPEVVRLRYQVHDEGLQCEIVRSDGEETCNIYNNGEKPCPATIFAEHDLVMKLEGVENSKILFNSFPPNRKAVQSLLADLRSVAESVEIRWVVDQTNKREQLRRSVDLEVLTEKQLNAIEKAVHSGYYSRPRETTQSELAEKCEISQSAMSQRLHTAERKLLASIFSDQ